MGISESKKKIVIDNYFKRECDVNTSIKEAFTKGFELGLKIAPIPQQTEWIPVTEKLPDKNDNYLCMIRFTKDLYLPMILGYAKSLYKLSKYDFPDKKGKGGWFDHDGEYGYFENTDVVAWMPLPTYKGVSE